MPNILISEDAATASRGTLVDANNVNNVYFTRLNGPTWPDSVPPGNYQFSCIVIGSVGTKVTVAANDADNPGTVLGTTSATLTGTPGATVEQTIVLNFLVP